MPDTNQDTATFGRFTKTLSDITSKPRTRTYAMITFSFIAITLLSWFAIRPTVRTILQLRREIADKSALNKRMDTKIASLIVAQNNYNSVQSKLTLLMQATPLNPDPVKLVSTLHQLESQTGSQIVQMNFKDVPLSSASAELPDLSLGFSASSPSGIVNGEGDNPAPSIAITNRLSGSFEAIRSYLSSLAQLRRLTSVPALDIKTEQAETADDITGTGQLQASMDIEAYYLQPDN